MRQRSGEFMQTAMDSWGDIVYRVALSQTCSHQDAQDVAQDVFLRLLTSPVEFEDGEHLKAWLLRATINRCRELHRSWWKRRVQGAGDAEAEAFANASALTDSSPTEEAALRAVERHPIWQALRKLPDQLRATVTLHYIEGISCAQIARIMECRPATVRTRLRRARTKLRGLL